MRPAGEVRLALLQACSLLAMGKPGQGGQVGQGVTLHEMAHHAQVGLVAARATVKNMRRAGQLHIAGHRRVAYRNRPVAEYVPAAAQPAPDKGCMGLAQVLRVWAG